jgi:3-phosphoshikimate 1-carboxyvinyltransferase
MNVEAIEKLQSVIHLPASKSISNRALIIGALCSLETDVQNVSDCDDSRVVLSALRDKPYVIDIKAAGTAMRFLTSLLSTMKGEHILTGTERMCNRPISVLVDALRSLGADINYMEKEGYPPLKIRGCALKGGNLSLASNVSSQYISSLLMIGPTLQEGLHLRLEGEIISRPYIEMTLSIMRQFGAKVYWISNNEICVEPKSYEARTYFVESDWSAASYWYEMVALSSDKDARVTMPGLFANSLQGDSVVAEMFASLGVRTSYENDVVIIEKGGELPSYYKRDMLSQPDLTQTIAVTCCMLGIPFRLTGLQTLRIKETDRIAALQIELGKLGYEIEIDGDEAMSWDGAIKPDAKTEMPLAIDTYDDHRMAMAFAPVALKRGSIVINNPDVVTKSYPAFWDDLRQVGFRLDRVNV